MKVENTGRYEDLHLLCVHQMIISDSVNSDITL